MLHPSMHLHLSYILISVYYSYIPLAVGCGGTKFHGEGILHPCQVSIATHIGCGVRYSPVRVYCTPAKNRSPHTLHVGYDIHQLEYTAPLPPHTLDMGYDIHRLVYTAKNRSPHTLDVGYDIHQLGYTAPLPRIDLRTHWMWGTIFTG